MRWLIWDFDGTLAFRHGMWSGALLQVLQQQDPHTTLTREDFRPLVKEGFPWHLWREPHCHLSSADAWWSALEPLFERAYCGVGLASQQAQLLAGEVRRVYCDPVHWHLFEDTLPTLSRLAAEGWTQIVLSNHVPELTSLIQQLGLAPFLARIVNSADTGYEKPHPAAFRRALADISEDAVVWMIGDNLAADVRGAEAVGIPAILVRTESSEARYVCPDLAAVRRLLQLETQANVV